MKQTTKLLIGAGGFLLLGTIANNKKVTDHLLKKLDIHSPTGVHSVDHTKHDYMDAMQYAVSIEQEIKKDMKPDNCFMCGDPIPLHHVQIYDWQRKRSICMACEGAYARYLRLDKSYRNNEQ